MIDHIDYIDYEERPPRYLYKYYSNLTYLKDVIVNNRIYLSKPNSFNDVFDSARAFSLVDFEILGFTEKHKEYILLWASDEYREKIKLLLKSMDSSKYYTLYKVFGFLSSNGVPEELLNYIKRNFILGYKNIQACNFKISCFSENCDSLLMWAHYGNHLKGGCLCFDTQKDPQLFYNAHKVNYSRYRSKERNFNFYFCKSEEWAYEQEWRVVVNDSNREYINTNSCVGIILGERVPWAPREGELEKFDVYMWELHMIAAHSKLNIYDAQADGEEYKINIIKRDIK